MDRDEMLPTWMRRTCALVRFILSVALGGALTAAAASFSTRLPGPALLWIVVLWPLLIFAMTVAHEAGHVLAAHYAGKTPTWAQVPGLLFVAERRGWRVRWRRIGRRDLGGFVLSVPDPDRPMKPQFVTTLTGGPLANVVVAVLAAIVAAVIEAPALRAFAVSFAVANVVLALLNLVPWGSSDGMNLLRWHRGVAADDPSLIYLRVLGMSLRGTMAHQMPDEMIASLERAPGFFAFFALWMRLKAAQNRQEWRAAADHDAKLDALLETLDVRVVAALKLGTEHFRAETAFSRALDERDASRLDGTSTSKELAWWVPPLAPRFDALRAALRGDVAARDASLAANAERSARLLDLAWERSEAILRDAIARCGVEAGRQSN